MQPDNCHILSLVPYRFLPASSGGHMAILYLHEYLGRLCNDHVISTDNNAADATRSFTLHKVFPASAKRYLPYHSFSAIQDIALKNHINYIICEHPYMALKAMRLSKKLQVPWFMRSHNIESERFRLLGKKWWPLLRYYEQYAMKKANGIFFITEEDSAWAQQHFGIRADKCHFIPYGTAFEKKPVVQPGIKQQLAKQLNLDANKPWLYFLGALDYAPNYEAVLFLLNEVVPRLNKKQQPYELLIAGKKLPEHIRLQTEATEHVTYTGFVDSLDEFIKANDIMLNPVLTGGGIKTKAIEALGYGKMVVSAQSGAAGLKPEICGKSLLISPDHDWDAFTNDIINALQHPVETADSFYHYYYCGNIARKALGIMQRT